MSEVYESSVSVSEAYVSRDRDRGTECRTASADRADGRLAFDDRLAANLRPPPLLPPSSSAPQPSSPSPLSSSPSSSPSSSLPADVMGATVNVAVRARRRDERASADKADEGESGETGRRKLTLDEVRPSGTRAGMLDGTEMMSRLAKVLLPRGVDGALSPPLLTSDGASVRCDDRRTASAIESSREAEPARLRRDALRVAFRSSRRASRSRCSAPSFILARCNASASSARSRCA
mmetsp:Transcript_15862/g.49614  ORF Transcript_15862/g.49614 Transcript_15862/m.49614 type:complete len:235 (-) Transcript_15862:288-992(-)